MAKKKGGSRYERIARALARDRNRSFRLATDVNEAIFANLLTTQRGAARRLDDANLRDLARLSRFQKRQLAAGRRATAPVDALERQAGGDAMLASLFAGERAEVQPLVKQGQKTALATKQTAKAQADTAGVVMDIMREGTKQAEAGAEYAANQALQAKTAEDVRMIAQMKHEEQLIRLQHRQDMERLRAQLQVEERAAQQELGGDFGGVDGIVSMLSRSAPRIMELHADGQDADAILNTLTEEGIVPDSRADVAFMRAYVSQLIDRLQNDTLPGEDTLAEDVIQLIRRIPEFRTLGTKKKSRIMDWIRARLTQSTSDYFDRDNGEPNDILSQIGRANMELYNRNP